MRYEDLEFENTRHIMSCVMNEMENPSRADISKRLGLSRTTVSNITSNLIDSHFLSEGSTIQTSSKGRPGNALMLNKDYWHTIGASFSRTAWNFVITNLAGEVKEHFSSKIKQPLTQANMIDSLIEGLSEIIKTTEFHVFPAVGIGAPGVVDVNSGDICFAHDLGWHNPVSVKEPIERATGFQAFVRNRYCLEGLAEFTYANVNKEKDVIYFGIGSGIRSAMFSNGKLIDGHDFTAGRMGHIQVEQNGKLCSCGRRGCLLTVANEEALVESAKEISGINRTSAQVISDADNGEKTAMEAVCAMAGYVSKVLNTVIDIINPQSIIMGGTIGSNSEYLKACIMENLGTAYRVGATPEIRRAKMKNDSGAIGATCLVKENMIPILYKLQNKTKFN